MLQPAHSAAEQAATERTTGKVERVDVETTRADRHTDGAGAVGVEQVEHGREAGHLDGHAVADLGEPLRESDLAGAFGHANPLYAYFMARLVHHGEHVVQAATFLTYEVAYGTAVFPKAQRASGRAVNAELVLDGGAGDVISLAERAVVVHQKFGNQEQRNTLITFWGIGLAGKDEVNDVLGGVVFAPGDVDLLARDPVAAVAGGLGPVGRPMSAV